MSRTQRAVTICALVEVALRQKQYEIYAETTGGRGMDQLEAVREAVADVLPHITNGDLMDAMEREITPEEFDAGSNLEVGQDALNCAIAQRLEWRDEWPDSIACGVRKLGE